MDFIKNIHSIVSCLRHLILSALFVCISFSAFALEKNSSGIYEIKSANDWKELRDLCIKMGTGKTPLEYIKVELNNDIKLSTFADCCPIGSWNAAGSGSWTSDVGVYFYGEFNGGNNTITVEMPTNGRITGNNSYLGLFGSVGSNDMPEQSAILNLKVVYKMPSRTAAVAGFGALVGMGRNVRIENCQVLSSSFAVTTDLQNGAGGLVGNLSNGTISDCKVTNSTFQYSNNNKKNKVGGICGQASNSVIENCHATELVKLLSLNASGIVSYASNSTVKECSFDGELGKDKYVFENAGGLCGTIENDVRIYNSYSRFALKSVSSVSNFGNLVGYLSNGASLTIRNCYSVSKSKIPSSETYGTAVGSINEEGNTKSFVDSCYVQYDANFTESGSKKGVVKGVSALKRNAMFMQSGCFAELLNNYAKLHTADVEASAYPLWYEDKLKQNEVYPILRGQTLPEYIVDVPFCHPNIFTYEHNPMTNLSPNSVTTLSGEICYLSEEQKSEGWIYGFIIYNGLGGVEEIIKSGTGKLTEVKDANGNIKFTYDYTISGKTTVKYRAFVQRGSDSKAQATGREYLIYQKSNKDETITGCDSVKYGDDVFYDNQILKEDGNTITIIVNHSDSTNLEKTNTKGLEKGCSSWAYYIGMDKMYEWKTEGHFILENSVSTTDKGCRKFTYVDVVNLGKPAVELDSVYILTLDNIDKQYVYNKVKEPNIKYTASVGSDWVVMPASLKGTVRWTNDAIEYKDLSKVNCLGKDSVIIKSIKYLSPVKVNSTPIITERCGEGYVTLYDGKEIYIKEDTEVRDVKIYTGSELIDLVGVDIDPRIDTLYEVVTYQYKVKKGSSAKVYNTEKIHEDKYAYQIDAKTHSLCDPAITGCDLTDKDYTFYITESGKTKLYYSSLADAQATCPSEITAEYNTVCSTEYKDSLVILGIENIGNPYVYKMNTGAGETFTAKVGKDWVATKTHIGTGGYRIQESLPYKSKPICLKNKVDSLVIHSVQYLSSVKYSEVKETADLCGKSVVIVGGIEYAISESTTIREVITYKGDEISVALKGAKFDPAITELYEVIDHHFTVKSQDIKPTNKTVKHTEPFIYEIDDNKLCKGDGCKTTTKDVVFYITSDGYYYNTLAEAQSNCPASIVAELNTYCSYAELDSVYVLTFDNIENAYTYKMNRSDALVKEYSVKVGKNWQLVASELPSLPTGMTDYIKHRDPNKEACLSADSIKVKSIKYVSPVRVLDPMPVEKKCGSGEVIIGGVSYNVTFDTTIYETKKYFGSMITDEFKAANKIKSIHEKIDTLYEIIPHPYKVVNTKIIDAMKGWKSPFVCEIDENTHTLCAETVGVSCKKTDKETVFYVVPDAVEIGKKYYYYTLEEASKNCPEIIYKETHKICLDLEIPVDTIVCGEFVDPYTGKIYAKDTVIRSKFAEDLPAEKCCSGIGYYIYNVKVNPRPEVTRVSMHGCGSINWTRLDGTDVVITQVNGKEKGVYGDTLKGKNGDCDIIRLVDYTIHTKATPKKYLMEECDSVSYEFFDGRKEWIKMDTTFRDIRKAECSEGCDCDVEIRDVDIKIYRSEVRDTLKLTGCDKYVYAPDTPREKEFDKSASFVETRTLPSGCISVQPVEITMFYSEHTSKDITVFDKFVAEDGWSTTVDDVHTVSLPADERGCVNTITYHVKIAKTEVLSDTTIYGCESVAYKKLNGTTVTYTESVEFIDVLPSKEAEGDAARRKVTIDIEYPKFVEKTELPHCGPREIHLKGLDKKVWVKETGYVNDTTVTNHGCRNVTKYYVPIIPVRTILDTVVACKSYSSAPDKPVNIGISPKVFELTTGNESSVKTADLQFKLDRTDSDVCKDDSFLHVEVHGVLEVTLPDLKACDAYDYVKMDGGIIPITESVVVNDTMKSAVCDCDSIIHHVKVVINQSSPYDPTVVHKLPAKCDSVVYFSAVRIKRLAFYDDATFMDTLINSVGCDSVVNYEVKVNHSTIQHEYISVCRDTSLSITTEDTTFQMPIYRSDTYRSLIAKTEDGCDNAIDYHVSVATPESIVMPEKHCGDTVINRFTYRVGEHILGISPASEKCFPDTLRKLYVYPTYSVDTTIVGCNVVTYAGVGYTENTTLTYNYPTMMGGCDSIVKVKIVVNQSSPIDNTVYDYGEIGCDSVVYSRGDKKLVLTETQVFSDTLENAFGCDSVVNYKATVFKTGSEKIRLTAYRDTILNINLGDGKAPIEISESGIYKDIIEALDNGCYRGTDYEVTIIIPDTLFIDGPKGCGAVTFNGEIYTTPKNGSVKEVRIFSERNSQIKSSQDTVTLVTVYPTYSRTERVQGCDVVEYDGKVFNVSQTFTYPTFSTVAGGCDSIVTLDVRVGTNSEDPFGQDAGQGCDSVIYERGNKKLVLYETTVFVDTFRNDAGCDSIVYRKVTVNNSDSRVVDLPSVCRETYLTLHNESGELVNEQITESKIYKDVLGRTPEGCYRGIDYRVTVTMPDTLVIDTTACGNIEIAGTKYDSGVENVNMLELTIGHNPADNCSPDTLYRLSIFPTYYEVLPVDGCNDYTFDGDTYTASGIYTLKYKTVRGGCDSIIDLQVNLHPVSDVLSTVRSSYLRSEYKKDTVVTIPMVSDYGCNYDEIKTYTVIPPKYDTLDVEVCRSVSSGVATFRAQPLLNDTVIVDSLYGKYDDYIAMSGDTLGVDTLRTIYVHINEPDTGYVKIDSCLHVTYDGVVYTESVELYDSSLKTVDGCDSIVHISINVNNCFPYPVLVNKYDWILICNDNIMSEDRFAKRSGVIYRWYRDSTFIAETTENYYTENKVLKGRYYVGVITEDGGEYFSDEISVYGDHSISLAPNPVEKGKPITIECVFGDETITSVEVYNAIGIKQVLDNLQITKVDDVSTIVVPGMVSAGHYFVRLASDKGWKYTVKFIVK